MVLHYADLAEEAGGVQGFILGSELVGLTRVRSASGVYPAVARLRALAAEVRAILRASTKIVYAADWTEYGAHVLDGGGEVRFPLDPLFADDDIDAVGIDYYPPISDWRDGPNHADLAAARSVYDVDYLRGRLGSGEAFDWYYATSSERNAQTRRPITDGAYGKPWVFRAEGSRLLVVEPAYGARGRRRDRRDRMAAAIEADLAHRDRHSRRRQGAERTERLSRSEILGIRLSAVLPRRARRSRPGARAGGHPLAFRPGPARLCGRVQSGLDIL